MAAATTPFEPVVERGQSNTLTKTERSYYQGKISEKDLIDQIRRQKREDTERMASIVDVMLSCYHQYRNKCDLSDKEAWQSDITIAKSHASVKHATANILKLILNSSQPVTVEDLSSFAKSLPIFFASDVEAGILKMWEVAKFKEVLRDVLEGGFACGLSCLKVIGQYSERNFTTIGAEGLVNSSRTEWKLGLHSIDPWRITFGSKSGQFDIDHVCEEMYVDVPTLKEMGFINLADLEKEDFSNQEYKDRERSRKDTNEPREHVRKQTRVWEYWGDVLDTQNQEIIAKDQHIFIGNENTIIREPETIPFWDRKKPYILFSPLTVAWRFPGQGILETSRAVKKAIDEIAQMQVDHLKFSLLNQYEVDMGTLENPEDIHTGVEPGKIFRKRPGTAAVPAFRLLDARPLTNDSFNAMLAYDKEYQRGTFITEQTQGLLDVKGETTATEIQQTQLNTTLMLSDIALHIEDTLLTPMAEKTWDRMFQFMDGFSNPSWSMLLGPRGQFIDQLDRGTRLAIIQGNYVFSARGLSRAIERQQNLQKLIGFVQNIAQFGEIAVPFLNMPMIFKRIFESFHFENPEEMISPMAQQVLYQMTNNLLMQQNPIAPIQAQAAGNQMTTQMKNQGAIDTENVKAQNQAGLTTIEQLFELLKNANNEGTSGSAAS